MVQFIDEDTVNVVLFAILSHNIDLELSIPIQALQDLRDLNIFVEHLIFRVINLLEIHTAHFDNWSILVGRMSLLIQWFNTRSFCYNE